jgi:hypothetical protein
MRVSLRGLNLYILLEVLCEEAVQVDLCTKMLEQGQILQRQEKTFRELCEKLFKLWDNYNNHHQLSAFGNMCKCFFQIEMQLNTQ